MRWPLSAADRAPERGSAVVDFVLVMVLLMPIVLGIVQTGLVLHVRNTLTAAASDGARAGARFEAGPEDAVARTRQLITAALADSFAGDVSARETTLGGIPTMEVVIAAEVPALGLLGPAVNLRVDGHAVKEIVP
ncbi:MAG TPA: TadE/TadG family type IV pilus assembly protein [Aeromicrobium sp.]|nr:TadE/TadG family type IV pilus assembly protein [Aeromicrobium sp.]HKY57049.1 TadE/TadG family type IV pilus assembly protein [Aeromicrobium sp.]